MDAKNSYDDYKLTLPEQYEFLESQMRLWENVYETTKDVSTPEENDENLKIIAGLKQLHESLGMYELVLGMLADEEETPEEKQCLIS